MNYYQDLREYVAALEKNGKLLRITQPVNKDTELHPFTRLQFRGLPEEERKAFYFENVYDSKGKKYSIPVLVGALGASPQIYSLGMMCPVEQISQRWQEAQLHPLKPVMVKEAPVQEVVFSGKNLLERGGLSEFPIPVSTPGWDVAPYITSPYCVSKDPESGIRNVGTYRSQIKSPTRTGICVGKFNRGLLIHWRKAKKMGKPLEAAIVVGAPPSIGYVSVSPLPVDVDEFAVAGGLAGKPLELVKCKTIDVEVPARAEIVIEGEVSTEDVEPEAPFGEASGYVGVRQLGLYLNVKCITHRREPIWQAFISQFGVSESSVIKQISSDQVIAVRLRHDLNMPYVRRAVVHYDNGSNRFIVLQLAKATSAEVWRALEAMPQHFPDISKIVIAVDEDIDPGNANLVNWAMSFRMQPHRDIRIVMSPAPDTMDHSVGPLPPEPLPCLAVVQPDQIQQSSCLLVDATLKWPYPPVSLPKKEYMERALQMWQEMGLPKLKLETPWYGYSLGHWSEEHEQQANLATKGDSYQTGEVLARGRQKV